MKFDYEIQTSEIIPPLPGGERYAAKVSFLGAAVTRNFGETWGKTEEEARQKMEQAVEEWIKPMRESEALGDWTM